MKTNQVKVPRKLIEVALPLDAINAACSREKSIRHGHPSTLHLYWARRPLAAARAVLFAQLVNDPGYENHDGFRRGVNKKEAAKERERLFKIIEDLVVWENSNNDEVLTRARAEILNSWKETCELNKDYPEAAELFNPEKLPAFHDLFAGGGAIPLEAQRLGLESYASDLNPVAVMINKAMIEIPPKFKDLHPVHPKEPTDSLIEKEYKGAEGLAEDVRYYGQWMRDEAFKRIGQYYPKVMITQDMTLERPDLLPYIGQELTVIAWIWARTVKSPNPAFSHVDVPLTATFVLSSKTGKEAYVEPIIEGDFYKFKVHVKKAPESLVDGTSLGRRGGFKCLLSGSPIDYEYIRNYGLEKGFGAKLLAIVADGPNGRIYLSPDSILQTDVSALVQDSYISDNELPNNTRDFRPQLYGLPKYENLFTDRQKLSLITFSELLTNLVEKVKTDAIVAGMGDDGIGIADEGKLATAYAEAVATYLAFAVDKCTDYWSTICTWTCSRETIRNTFGRQAIPMSWDFIECNPFSEATGNWLSMVNWVWKTLELLPANCQGFSVQAEAQAQTISKNKVISTDPPYYDNIGYADLSDFFYVWMRRNLRNIYPRIFGTIATPKLEELIAAPYRHESKQGAEEFFLKGMTKVMAGLTEQANPAFPVTIYYAFKQSETKEHGTASTGWVTFLDAVIKAGFVITGTWPLRTEREGRTISIGANALASSVVLVCRRKSLDAPIVSRREFQRELNATLPDALAEMAQGGQHSAVAPVDMSQAIIGPGMGIFSKYKAVIEADGTPMTVKTALQLINRFLAEDAFDAETQFCLTWFETNLWNESSFGEADLLARAKGISVDDLRIAGVLESAKGKAKLHRWDEYSSDWDPHSDTNIPVWEALHQLIRALNHGGESEAGAILAAVSEKEASIRVLAYRLYTLCERKGWAEDARYYNELIGSWDSIKQASESVPKGQNYELEL